MLLNLLVLLLGSIFGLFMKLLMPQKRSKDNKLIISVALLFAFCGVCALLDLSPLLGCMVMGTVYTNIADDDKLFKQLNYFSPPLLLLFFVRSGMSFQLDALISPAGALDGVPLLVIGASYFLVRILGKYAGAWLGCLLGDQPDTGHFDSTGDASIGAVIIYLTGRNAPFFACLFERHVIHVHTSDNISYYISSARRTQGRKCE